MIIGIFAGSFDPPTLGHINLIERSFTFCDKLIIAIGVNSAKHSLFSQEERIELIKDVMGATSFGFSKIEIVPVTGLLVDFAKAQQANILIRGIRTVADFEYESNLANINKKLAPSIETVMLAADPNLSVVSSSAVKEIARYGGDIAGFVPTCLIPLIKEKIKNNSKT